MSAATLRELLTNAARRLAEISETPRLDAEVLLAAALERPRGYLHAWPERLPEPEPAARFAAWLDRRCAGEPVAYLLGRREFWSLELEVTPDTLIPRPETELLVELALARLPADRPLTIADLGAGSGAIALALAVERPLARIVATDQSAAALAVARRNARRLEIRNVQFREGDWCAPLGDERFNLIAAESALHRCRRSPLATRRIAFRTAGGTGKRRGWIGRPPRHHRPSSELSETRRLAAAGTRLRSGRDGSGVVAGIRLRCSERSSGCRWRQSNQRRALAISLPGRAPTIAIPQHGDPRLSFPAQLRHVVRVGSHQVLRHQHHALPRGVAEAPADGGKVHDPGDQVIGGPEGMTHSPQAIIKV